MGSPRDWMETVKETVERIKVLIGSPTDTGGSATAGTVMGKENTIIEKVDKIAMKQFNTKLARMVMQDQSGGTILKNSENAIYTFTVPSGVFFSAISISLTAGAGFTVNSEITIGGITYPVTISVGTSNGAAAGIILFTERGLRKVGVDTIQPVIFPKLEAGEIKIEIPSDSSGMYARDITVATLELYYYEEV